MSDKDDVTEPEEKAEDAAEKENQQENDQEEEKEAGETEAEGETEDEESEDEEEPKPKRKRPGKAARQIQRLERLAERQSAQIEALMRTRSGDTSPSPQKADQQQAPRQEDFQDYTEYLDARARFVAEQHARQILDEERSKFTKTQADRARQAQVETYAGRVAAAREKYEDFDEVAFDESVQITEAMTQAIMGSEVGPDVAYYLGSHPDEAAKIANSDPYSQVRAIGVLEAKLSTPKPRNPTSAPEPIKPIGGRGANPKKIDPDKLPIDEWLKKRNAGEIR